MAIFHTVACESLVRLLWGLSCIGARVAVSLSRGETVNGCGALLRRVPEDPVAFTSCCLRLGRLLRMDRPMFPHGFPSR